MNPSLCRRGFLLLAVAVAICAFPNASFAQCDWNTGSVYTSPYYSIATWKSVLYVEAEDGSSACCYHEYGLEVWVNTTVQTSYGLSGSAEETYDPPSFSWGTRFWVGCYCVMSIVSYVEDEGEEPIPDPTITLDPGESYLYVGDPRLTITATVSPPAFQEVFSWDGDGETNPEAPLERWAYTSSAGLQTILGMLHGEQAAQATVQVTTVPIPTGETTVLFNWQGGGGISQWWQNLLPSTVSFDGRTVKEFTGAGAVDNCYSQVPNSARPPLVALTGGEWPVEGSENLWGPDNISWAQEDINYYRAQGVAPCSATIPQSMRINVGSGWVEYVNHNLIYTIGVTTITYQRGSAQPRSKPWP